MAALVLALLGTFGCGPRGRASAGVQRPAGPLSLEDARRYVLDLVNRDRADEGLPPVELDETATRGAQRHADDMASHGFTAHWGTDGSVQEQRYSESGGEDNVQENVGCFADGVARKLDPSPMFAPAELEKIEHGFISEKPPHDGHRRNILREVHNKLGVGLAKPVGIDIPCMAQEFVDDYGEYESLPKKARVGQKIKVEGEVRPPMRFGGVGIARIDAAEPMSPAELNQTNGYSMPTPFINYFPAGFKTPKPVAVDGNHFSIEVPLDERKRPGRYEVVIWGNRPEDGKELQIIGVRVIHVR